MVDTAAGVPQPPQPAPAGTSRRNLFKGAAAVAVGAAVGMPPVRASAAMSAPVRRVRSRLPIEHVVIDCQENRSFDTYFGFAPWIGKYGVPTGYTQPNDEGKPVHPFHFPDLTSPDVYHDWLSVHHEWNEGRMNGFVRADGRNAVGYYTGRDLPFYYSLHERFTLCVNYFCSLLGPTYPNRFYLASGTSGGITTNGVYGYGVLDWPCILDLLEEAGVTWKVYNIGYDDVPTGYSDNVFVFFRRFAHDDRAWQSRADYLRDVKSGRLPQVSFIIPSYTRGWDEHPPADVQVGMRIQRELITALWESDLWPHAAYLLTYDEHGGYFDHVPPPQFDAYGAGIRVPTWVISPYAKKGHLEPALYEHASTLKFLERLFGLPTLASVNHRFDKVTPGGPNNQAAGGYDFGPAAPPRDRLDAIGDLTECFTFS